MKKEILVKEDGEIKKISISVNEMFNMFSGIIKGIALRKSRNIPKRYVDDIIQDAYLSSVELFQQYDIKRGSLFLSYLSISLYNNIQRIARKYCNWADYVDIDDFVDYEFDLEEIVDSSNKTNLIEILSGLSDEECILAELSMNGVRMDDRIKEMNISFRKYYSILERVKEKLKEYL